MFSVIFDQIKMLQDKQNIHTLSFNRKPVLVLTLHRNVRNAWQAPNFIPVPRCHTNNLYIQRHNTCNILLE